jgi:hypothetical protein
MNINTNKKITNFTVDIVKGYKGIMDLDLTLVPNELKKQMIDQHYKDIDIYNIEQSLLEPRLRYENTIERIEMTHKKTQSLILKRLKLQEEKRVQHNKDYNNSCLK